MHYYKHHIGDFLKDTGHLTNEQMGVYMRMLWRYYMDEKPLEDDCEGIAFAMRSDEKTVRLLLRHFFVLTESGWAQKRCDREIKEFHYKSEKARDSANARWMNAKAMRTHNERNADESKIDANQEPITNNQKKKEKEKVNQKESASRPQAVACPVNVDPKVWSDWLRLRKAKKAPVTESALAGIQREALSAGMSLQDAIAHCCVRGWAGFKAEWMHNAAQTQYTKQPMRKSIHDDRADTIRALTGRDRQHQGEIIDIGPDSVVMDRAPF